MSSFEEKAKEKLKRSLGKGAGKKIKNKDILLNKNFKKHQAIATFADLAGNSTMHEHKDGDRKGKPKKISELKVVQKALQNLLDEGRNLAIGGFSEYAQLSAFLSSDIEDVGGGVRDTDTMGDER